MGIKDNWCLFDNRKFHYLTPLYKYCGVDHKRDIWLLYKAMIPISRRHKRHISNIIHKCMDVLVKEHEIFKSVSSGKMQCLGTTYTSYRVLKQSVNIGTLNDRYLFAFDDWLAGSKLYFI